MTEFPLRVKVDTSPYYDDDNSTICPTDDSVSVVSSSDTAIPPPKSYYNRPVTIMTPDAINKKKKIIKEFYGCYFHGCQKCFPDLTEKYNKTKQREDILKMKDILLMSCGSVSGRN